MNLRDYVGRIRRSRRIRHEQSAFCQQSNPLLLKRVLITLPLFSSPHASLWSLRLFSAFSPMAFSLFSRLSSPLSASFFSHRGRRCLAQSLPFYRPDDACRLFCLHRLFSLSRAPFYRHCAVRVRWRSG
ncbi:hypothetical protein P12B_c4274 [Escherichia coli P12b]|nr:hypothetical protein P12B_c4274 [Escherichia coli P12b]ESE17692.1 hypothetical protein HMPREF1623_04330 [Escherichia coli 910096-2]